MDINKYETERTQAFRRKVNFAKALRKKRIYAETHPDENDLYDNLNQYSKNKIHCSDCTDARYHKTNNKSPRKRKVHGNYAPSYNPRAAEKRRNDSMNEDEFELKEE